MPARNVFVLPKEMALISLCTGMTLVCFIISQLLWPIVLFFFSLNCFSVLISAIECPARGISIALRTKLSQRIHVCGRLPTRIKQHVVPFLRYIGRIHRTKWNLHASVMSSRSWNASMHCAFPLTDGPRCLFFAFVQRISFRTAGQSASSDSHSLF